MKRSNYIKPTGYRSTAKPNPASQKLICQLATKKLVGYTLSKAIDLEK